ncbi:hypothetical protein ABPG72_015543 [Tetrahymena utriculariae]
MSTITSTEPAPTSATHVNPTPTTIKVNLVCEDRDTAKKCLFKDLKASIQSDNTIKVIDLIEKNISLQYFLNNCMIFQPSDDDMDIMIGFYPSEEIQNQFLSIDSKINIALKFEKIRTPSSESKKEENLSAQVNQNQISNNKNTNNNNNINNNLHIRSNKTNRSAEPHIPQLKAISSTNNNTSSSHPNHLSSPKLQSINQNLNSTQENCQKPEINTAISTGGAITNNTSSQIIFGKAATASQLSNEDLNNNDSLTMSSHSLNMESEGCSQQLEPSAVSNPNNNLNDKNSSDKAKQNDYKKAKADSNVSATNSQKGFKLNRKRKVSETLEHCSESCSNQNESKDLSPCTSFTENDVPKMKKHQSAITNDPTLSEAGETNNCFTNSMNLSLSGKLPINLYGQSGLNIGTHNSNFHAYNPNPLSNITNSSINNNSGFSAQSNCGGKQIEGSSINSFQYQLHQQGGLNSANSNSNNNNSNNMNRQSRNKERTIREAIEMVTKWRDLQEEYRQKHQVKGLQEVADELNISKKVLDYYFQELRTAEFFGFDFDSNLGNKMGVLRKYIDEQKKNHEQKNKNFKITRNLQFKYRLKDYQSTSFLSNSSSLNINNCTNNMGNNNANNNDALSSTSSQKSKEKFQQKQQSKMEQITSLLSSSASNGQVKVEEMVIENENNFNFPSVVANSNNINISGITTANSSSTTTSNDFQKLLSKNSPNFLQFLNHSQTCTTNNNANTFPSATPSSSFSNSSSAQLNANHSNSAQSSLNFLSNLTNSAQGFSINGETTKKQQASIQPQQLNQTNAGDKNFQFLDMLLFGNEKSSNSNNNNSNNPNQQMDNLISLLKMISQNDEPSNADLAIPSFQKSHSVSSSLLSNKFSDEDFLNKKRIAVIQIRKQDE